MVDYLSNLNDKAMLKLKYDLKISGTFLDELVLGASQDFIPLFTNFVNYLVSDMVPEDLSFWLCEKFMNDTRKFF